MHFITYLICTLEVLGILTDFNIKNTELINVLTINVKMIYI